MGSADDHTKGSTDVAGPELPPPHDLSILYQRKYKPLTISPSLDLSVWSYTVRIPYIIARLQTLAEGCQKEAATKLMLSTVVGLASDAVPNVKFNVAKTLMRIGQWLDQPTLQQQVKPVLEKLRQDTDSDVQYFAAEAMDSELAVGFL